MFSREALKKICYGIPAAETFCIAGLHYLSALPVNIACLHCLSALPVSIACLHCLSILPVCTAFLHYLSVLPVCTAFLHYLSVLPVCTAFLHYLSVLPDPIAGPYYPPCSCSSNRYFSYRNFSGSVTWKSFARRRKSSG